MSIENAHGELDQLSERVEQFQERVVGISDEPKYNSIAVRALRAGQLATELSALVRGISEDTEEYLGALAPLQKSGAVRGSELAELVEFAEDVTGGTSGSLGDVPRAIDFMGASVDGLMAVVAMDTKLLGGYTTKLNSMATGLNKLGNILPERKKDYMGRVQEQATAIKTTIEQGKATI